MDLAFKMVAGKTNVFTIATWNAQANRANTYTYVFINKETRDTYKTLFEKLFKVLGDVARKPVTWAYDHGNNDNLPGIRTVTLDMCKKQAADIYLFELCDTYAEHMLNICYLYRAWRLSLLPQSSSKLARTSSACIDLL